MDRVRAFFKWFSGLVTLLPRLAPAAEVGLSGLFTVKL